MQPYRSVVGDLNKDDRADMVVVMEFADSVREIRGDSIENTGRPKLGL